MRPEWAVMTFPAILEILGGCSGCGIPYEVPIKPRNIRYQRIYDNLRMSIRRRHDDVMTWKRFPHYWPLVRGIHRSSPRRFTSQKANNTINRFPSHWAVAQAVESSLLLGWIVCGNNNNPIAGGLCRLEAHMTSLWCKLSEWNLLRYRCGPLVTYLLHNPFIYISDYECFLYAKLWMALGEKSISTPVIR